MPVQRHIVISAVNIRKGGTLTVLKDCLRYLSAREDVKVTAFVHKRELFDIQGIDYIEMPWSVDSWWKRLRCEYRTMPRLSRKLPPIDLWLSLHDSTPPVKARRQAVYCHNSFPFMGIRLQDFRMDYKIPLFSLFTSVIYKAYVRRNSYLIVQADWMREALSRLLKFDKERIIISPPAFKPLAIPEAEAFEIPTFIYPSTPDAHKNFETLCEAASLLESRIGPGKFRVCLTLSGTENRYARWLKTRWGKVQSLDFHGYMSREELSLIFARAVCLVFPSRTETWGLPISEFLPTGKPMILSDRPYAHETAAGAARVAFFPVMDAAALSGRMQDVLEEKWEAFGPVEVSAPASPYVPDWASLFDCLLS